MTRFESWPQQELDKGEAPSTYKVKLWDTLWIIAQKNGFKNWQELAKIQKPWFNPNKIYPEQEISLRNKEKTLTAVDFTRPKVVDQNAIAISIRTDIAEAEEAIGALAELLPGIDNLAPPSLRREPRRIDQLSPYDIKVWKDLMEVLSWNGDSVRIPTLFNITLTKSGGLDVMPLNLLRWGEILKAIQDYLIKRYPEIKSPLEVVSIGNNSDTSQSYRDRSMTIRWANGDIFTFSANSLDKKMVLKKLLSWNPEFLWTPRELTLLNNTGKIIMPTGIESGSLTGIPKNISINGDTWTQSGPTWPNGNSSIFEFRDSGGSTKYLQMSLSPSSPRFPNFTEVTKPPEVIKLR